MQADRLTPEQEAQILRMLADMLRGVTLVTTFGMPPKHPYGDIARRFHEEAARREAEAKPQSAATGHYENDCEELGREDSAAVPQTQTQGEREGPDSAAAADGLWVGGNPDGHGVPLSYSYAGFTLAEVRRLAEAFVSWAGEEHLTDETAWHPVIRPFLPLLKETT